MYYTEYITVVFKNWKGERVEVPCDNERQAQIEQDKLKRVGLYSWIEWSAYMPFDTVSNISEQIGDLYES